jgi:hypothetical protein
MDPCLNLLIRKRNITLFETHSSFFEIKPFLNKSAFFAKFVEMSRFFVFLSGYVHFLSIPLEKEYCFFKLAMSHSTFVVAGCAFQEAFEFLYIHL